MRTPKRERARWELYPLYDLAFKVTFVPYSVGRAITSPCPDSVRGNVDLMTQWEVCRSHCRKSLYDGICFFWYGHLWKIQSSWYLLTEWRDNNGQMSAIAESNMQDEGSKIQGYKDRSGQLLGGLKTTLKRMVIGKGGLWKPQDFCPLAFSTQYSLCA